MQVRERRTAGPSVRQVICCYWRKAHYGGRYSCFCAASATVRRASCTRKSPLGLSLLASLISAAEESIPTTRNPRSINSRVTCPDPQHKSRILAPAGIREKKISSSAARAAGQYQFAHIRWYSPAIASYGDSGVGVRPLRRPIFGKKLHPLLKKQEHKPKIV